MRKVIIHIPDEQDPYLAVKHVGVQLEEGFTSGYDPSWSVESESGKEEDSWLIWSIEHNAWWAASYNGYVSDRLHAGKYPYQEALRIVGDSNKHPAVAGFPNEAMIKA